MLKGFCHKADNDGMTSAAILKFKYPEIELVYMDYGDPFPWDTIDPTDTVYMCDFSLKDPEQMLRLSKMCNLIWIDHHNSIIEKVKAKGYTFNGIQRNGLGACGLTWEYLFPDKDVPRSVKHLAEYDVWNKSHPNTTAFEYGMRTFNRYITTIDTDEVSKLWDHVLTDNEDDPLYSYSNILLRGQIALDYYREFAKRYSMVGAFETKFQGYRTLCCNVLTVGSTIFDSIRNHNEYDIYCIFGFVGDGWNIGWYCDSGVADVGSIAAQYGGGGHKSSSGAHVETLPPELTDQTNIKLILID